MCPFAQSWYELKYKVAFAEKKADEFQDFFASIMEKCHPGDFQRIMPWGKAGDKKNDGYLRSERMLFQCYAPRDLKQSETLRKIDTDFTGALSHWKEHFDKWVFVHNSRDGLSPDVKKKLLDLSEAHKPIIAIAWGFEELKQRLFRLREEDIASLLGPAPSSRDVQKVGVQGLSLVLKALSAQAGTPQEIVRSVPRDKAEQSRLSKDALVLLKAGMFKADSVKKLFNGWPDPRFGDQVAGAFREKYEDLCRMQLAPDDIFHELHVFAGSTDRGVPQHEAAVLAVLAYLFERCDIFGTSLRT